MSPHILLCVIFGVMTCKTAVSHKAGHYYMAMCPDTETNYRVPHGSLSVRGTVSYRLDCLTGYTLPWGYDNNTFVCTTHGHTQPKPPQSCVSMVFAHRNITFEIKPILVESEMSSQEFCDQHMIQLEADYNRRVKSPPNPKVESTDPKTKGRLYPGYLADCRVVHLPHLDHVKSYAMEFVITGVKRPKVLPSETDKEDLYYQNCIIMAFNLLKDLLEKAGHLTDHANPKLTTEPQLYTNISTLVQAYTCPAFTHLRLEKGLAICASCGRGWWLGEDDKCHPCGPGTYNDQEAADECKHCPFISSNMLWSARSHADCFIVHDHPEQELNLTDNVFYPVVFSLLILVMIVLWSKIHMQEDVSAHD